MMILTGSARLFGDRQGDLGEGKDVDLRAILGGGRGQMCLVLLSVSVVKLLVNGAKTHAGISHPLPVIPPVGQWDTMVAL